MKTIYKILAVLLALCFAATGFAASVTDNEHGVLKLDRKNTDMLPDNFRTSDYAFEKDLLGGKAPGVQLVFFVASAALALVMCQLGIGCSCNSVS